MANVLKFQNIFLFLFSKNVGFRAGTQKILIKLANREDPDQTASSDMGICMSRPFWQATSV